MKQEELDILLFDYVEGNLPANKRKEVETLLKDQPELTKEVSYWSASVLERPSVTMPNKGSMVKKSRWPWIAGSITAIAAITLIVLWPSSKAPIESNTTIAPDTSKQTEVIVPSQDPKPEIQAKVPNHASTILEDQKRSVKELEEPQINPTQRIEETTESPETEAIPPRRVISLEPLEGIATEHIDSGSFLKGHSGTQTSRIPANSSTNEQNHTPIEIEDATVIPLD